MYMCVFKLLQMVTWGGSIGNGMDGGWDKNETLHLDLFEQCECVIRFFL